MAFTSTPSALQTYNANEKVQVTVTFSEPVYVVTTDGTPQIALTIGTKQQQAIYETGSTTKNALTFGYTVQSADIDTDGIEIKKDTLDANNGTIQDAAGNNAVLTHKAVPTDSTHKVNGSIVNLATAPPAPTLDKPSVTSNTGFTITWTTGAFDAGTHKKSDGEALTSAEVSYTLYYAASADASTLGTVENIKAVAKQAVSDSAATGGVETVGATAPLSKTVSGKAFIGTVYMVIEAINTDNPSKTALSGTKSYPITGLAAKGTGTAPSIAVAAGTKPGEVRITLSDPSDWGTRGNGVAVEKKDITFWLFYLQDKDGTKTHKNITDALDNSAVHTAALLASPDTTEEVIQRVIQIAHDATSPFVIIGLEMGAQYSFFVRLIHPDGGAGTNADERTKYARDTAVVQGTAKAPLAWHVSHFATGFTFKYPEGIAVAEDGTLYVTDTGNNLVKTITKEGVVSILAGTGKYGMTTRKTGTSAKLGSPSGPVIAPDGSALYIVVQGRSINKIALTAPYPVSTIAGGPIGGSGNHAEGASAYFNGASVLAIAPDGSALYVADIHNKSIRKIVLTAPYPVSTITKVKDTYKEGVAATTDTIYATTGNSVKKLTLNKDGSLKAITTIATGFNVPSGIALAPNGTLYVADTKNNVIKQLTLKGDGTYNAPTIIAGEDGKAGKADGIGTTAQFNRPSGIVAAKDKDGNTLLYVADTQNNSIRKLEYK